MLKVTRRQRRANAGGRPATPQEGWFDESKLLKWVRDRLADARENTAHEREMRVGKWPERELLEGEVGFLHWTIRDDFHPAGAKLVTIAGQHGVFMRIGDHFSCEMVRRLAQALHYACDQFEASRC